MSVEFIKGLENFPKAEKQEAVVEEEFIVDTGDGEDNEVLMPDPEIAPRSAETEIVIEDDTPSEDQNRTPLPDDVRENLELEEDASNYSKGVQKRMDQLTKAMHDERREKEAAYRERDTAANLTRQYIQQAQQYAQQSQQKDVAYVEQRELSGKSEIEAARKEYQAAFNEGDAKKVVEAQYKLNEAQHKVNQAEMQKAQLDRNSQRQQQAQQQQPIAQQPQQGYTQQQQPKLDEATQKWVDDNKEWFNKDEVMYSTAMGFHQKIVNEGFREGSPEYFRQIDAGMRETFPDKFPEETKRRPPSTVVSPGGRLPQGRKVVLTESEARLARTMNLTLEQYAAAKAKMGAS